MSLFGKKEKKIPTEELQLKDHDAIWTKFCFLDETGDLVSEKDPYFTVGIIKMSQPYYLQSKLLYQRNVDNFHDEMKFNKLSKRNIDFAKFAVGAFLDTRSIDFYSYTTHKDSWYFKEHFNNDQWTAYEKITLKLLDAALSENEILILLADRVTTPKRVKYEVDTKRKFNSSEERLALAGVCRFDSRSNDLLQVVDLLIGAVSYDLRFADGVVPGSKYKLELVNFLKENLGTNSLKNGFKNRHFNIFVENSR
jgi:hypothetical protein